MRLTPSLDKVVCTIMVIRVVTNALLCRATGIYNPFSETMVQRVWGQLREAEKVSEWSKRTGIKLDNIADDDRIIWISPGETILGHTNEFIGGTFKLHYTQSAWHLKVC